MLERTLPSAFLDSARRCVRQWLALFAIYLEEGFAYRASGFIWVLTDAATTFVMPLVWIAAGKGAPIKGFGPNDFVLYYLCMLVVGSFVTSHFMWDISWEIREGIFSTHIIRPISYFQFILARNLAWRSIRTVISAPWFLLFVAFYGSHITGIHLHMGWEFWTSLLLGHMVSVCFVLAMAMLALFTQEAQSIFELYYIPMLFLSGQVFPIAVFPDWVRGIAKVFPFYYTTGAPTEILIGRLTGPAAVTAIGMQVGWILVSVVVYKVLWRLGMKHYTGIGM